MNKRPETSGLIDITEYLPSLLVHDFSKIDRKHYKEIRNLSSKTNGASIAHISGSRLRKVGEQFTIGGGGLAEMLKIQIPLERSLGIDSHLYLGALSQEFYGVCRSIFNDLLDSSSRSLSRKEKDVFEMECSNLKDSIDNLIEDKKPEIIVVHDFEYIPVIDQIASRCPTILHWHVDFPESDCDIARYMGSFIEKFSLVIVSDAKIGNKIKYFNKNVHIVPPSINPISVKNSPLSMSETRTILEKTGVDSSQSILTQIGRFSLQKNPLRAINIFLAIRESDKNVQLLLVGFNNLPGEETELLMKKISEISDNDRNIHVFSDISQLGSISQDMFLNAIYTASDVILNMSYKEAFGLVITEGMWKQRVVVAQESSGATLQIRDGVNGYIVNSLQDTTSTIEKVLHNRILRHKIGREARKSVQNNYLITRYLRDVLTVYKLTRQ